jgi:hypothetical protein
MCVNTGCSSCTGNCGCNCTSCCSNDCNNCCEVTDPCQEQGCGCDLYVPAACVRITGNPLECLEISTGQTLEEALESINNIVCDLSSSEDGEDGDSAYQIWLNLGNSGTEQDFIDSLMGDDGQGVDHVSFTSSTGGGGAGVAGETDTYTVWGDVGETINLGTFVVYNGVDGTIGNDGEFGGWSGEWIYDVSTVPGSILATELRFNSLTLSSVTEIYINETNADSTDYSAFLDSFSNTVLGTDHYGLVRVWKRFDSNTFFYGEVTLTQDNGGYRTINVTHIQSNGTFTDTDNLVVSFTPNGVAGQPQLDTGWKDMNAWTMLQGYGFPNYSSGSLPRIRVIGREVFISGNITLPLADDLNNLITDVLNYKNATNSLHVKLWIDPEGGFDVTSFGPGGLVSQSPILPPDLWPTTEHRIENYQMASRAITSTGTETRGLLLTTLFSSVRILTDGRLYSSTIIDADDGASSSFRHNSHHHFLVSQHTANDPVFEADGTRNAHHNSFDIVSDDNSGGTSALITGVTYKIKSFTPGDDFTTVGAAANATGEIFIATGTSPTWQNPGSTLLYKIETDIIESTASTYPATIDAEQETDVGGFFFNLSTSFPIDETLTDAQVLAAWNSI